jgi:hypothetical protein
MRAKSAGLPKHAPIAPAVRPIRAFWTRGSGFPSFASTALFVKTLKKYRKKT